MGAIATVVGIVACGGGDALLPETPKFEPGASKCGTAENDWRPLLVEWSAADRAALESRIGVGLVAARVTGCDIQILPACEGPSRYVYTAITPKLDTVRMRNADELQATIPFGAARFGANLARSGELSVRMNVVGIYAAEQASVRAEDMKGSCDAATHVITGFAAGAFELTAGAAAAVGAGASFGGVGADGKSTSSREMLNKDGDEAACARSQTTDPKPPEGCGAVLRLSLVRIACFEGMHYVEGKGCRKTAGEEPTYDENMEEHRTLVTGVEQRLTLLEVQLKDIPNGSPVWAKRTEELQKQWNRASLKARFEHTTLEATVLRQGTPATPAQAAHLERLKQLADKAERASAGYATALAQ